MPADAPAGAGTLVDRRAECAALDRLIAEVVAGQSRCLVLRGPAGVGKTVLLGYLAERVTGWRVTRAVGVESEMELAYSGLHQICAPLLDHLDRLPAPQRDALQTVFGLRSGPAPERFLVGLAVLSLFADVAEQHPLICVVDDAQWLDQASAQVIEFTARRLLAERVALVCAARTGAGDDVLAGLAALPIEGLDDGHARELLMAGVHGPVDAAVYDQIVAESHGNPLALVELPRTWSVTALAGGFGFPGGEHITGKIEQSYRTRVLALPPDTRLLVLAAAAEPLGNPLLLHRAAELLHIDMAAADPAVDAGLLQLRGRVEFAHPLVRSAVYQAAAAEDRRRVHHALAQATDPGTDPDRRVWHRARAAPGLDEHLAADLEASAGRAQARGGLAAAAAFLQRSVALTPEPARRAERALAGAQASLHAGAFDAALGLLAEAETGPPDDLQRIRVDLLRGQIAFTSGRGGDASPLLLRAAKALEPLDAGAARETYLTAWAAAVFAGRPDTAEDLLAVCRAVRALAPPSGAARPVDLLLDGLVLLQTEGRAAAAPVLLRAGRAIADGAMAVEDTLRWAWLATAASNAVWDNESTDTIARRTVQIVRDAGALAQLPVALAALGTASASNGDLAGAAALVAEADSVAAATGSRIAPYAALRLLALQGSETEAWALITGTIEYAAAEGQQLAAINAYWAEAVLHNGFGRFAEAGIAAGQATANTFEPFVSMWALPELVEAAARSDQGELARAAVNRLAETTRPCGTEWALGVEARSRALVSAGGAADDLYREGIERLGRTGMVPELARAHLLYGEWLRSERRRRDARAQLRAAHDMLTAIGMQAFAERARRELIATGENVRRHTEEAGDQLTPQEEQIARLARDGLSNPQIGAQLFLSPRTVEWHLRKVFAKLGISSRRELRASRRGLRDQGSTPGSSTGASRAAQP
ncbi:AAA family ATPase [Actinoplanes sp. NBC_00393]|uniref:helix-turn-helix transcriptional regulator n=1 Tax=Actinoplanes sp. NBC_00393 TaxID=2975953 RepID=UPI002E223CA3